MSDSDTHPSVDTNAIKALSRDLRDIREKLDVIIEKIADGQTKMALQDQRLDTHSSLIAGLQIGQSALREEIHVVRQESRDRECDNCDARIEKLEVAEVRRADREEQAKNVPWWLTLLVSAILSIAIPWVISGMAHHVTAAP